MGINARMVLAMADAEGVLEHGARILAALSPVARMGGAPYYDPTAASRAIRRFAGKVVH